MHGQGQVNPLEKREGMPPFRARDTMSQGVSCSPWVRVEGMGETRREPAAGKSAVWQQVVTGTITYSRYTDGIIQNLFLFKKSQ